MTLKEQIHNWMAGREDEFVAALAPLIAIDSTTGESAPGMPFGPGPDAAMKAISIFVIFIGIKGALETQKTQKKVFLTIQAFRVPSTLGVHLMVVAPNRHGFRLETR